MTAWMIVVGVIILTGVWYALAQFLCYWLEMERDRTESAPRAPGRDSRKVG